MKKHSFKPMWRKGKEDIKAIEVVSSPDRHWFQNLSDQGEGRQDVRFALMENGAMYFGDAFTVMHHDIMQLRETNGVQPLLVGIILKMGGVWRLANVQYFGCSEDGSHRARGLLPALVPWNEAMKSLGHDPLALPNWGEE